MKLFPARPLIIDRWPAGRGHLYIWHRKPFVTLLSARRRAVASPADLRAWGYRHVATCPITRGAYYARPWLLWALLKTASAVRDVYWRTIGWLYQRGVFHLAGGENADFRWRDVRPGPAK